MLNFSNTKHIFSPENTIYVSDCRNQNSEAVRNRIVGLLQHQFKNDGRVSVHTKRLQQRFPIEDAVWQGLLSDAPRNYLPLTRGLNLDVLVWIKTDRLCNRLKFTALSSKQQRNDFNPRDFVFNEIEPLPIEHLPRYAPILALFTLAHTSCFHSLGSLKLQNYTHKLEYFSKYLDNEILSLSKNMPAHFSNTLKHLQIWAWQISGEINKDKAKLGHVLRSYHHLLEENTDCYSHYELGQLLSNISISQLSLAQISSGSELFESSIDAINKAQTVYDRVSMPLHWVKLQQLKANAQLGLAARLQDNSFTEQAIHSLQTVRRIFLSQNKKYDAATTDQKIGDLLRQLGHTSLGTERLEQAASTYSTALSNYAQSNKEKETCKTHYSLGCTLTDIGDRVANELYFRDAVQHLSLSKNGRFKGKEYAIALAEARAFVGLGTLSKISTERHGFLTKAVRNLKNIIKHNQYFDIDDQILSLELLSQACRILGQHQNENESIAASCHYLREAISLKENVHPADLPGIGKLYSQLAKNLAWLHSKQACKYNADDAIAAYNTAITYSDKPKNSKTIAILHGDLAELLVAKARIEFENKNDCLDQAIHNYKRSLNHLRRSSSPFLWARHKYKLAEAFALSGALGGGTAHLELAVEAYEKVLEEWTVKSDPQNRAVTLNKMAHVLTDIARREESDEKLSLAQSAFDEAHDIFLSLGNQDFSYKMDANLSNIAENLEHDIKDSEVNKLPYVNELSSNMVH